MHDHPIRSAEGESGDSENERLRQLAPEPPRLNPNLPAHPDTPKSSNSESAAYTGSAIATSAVSSFVTPIIVLSLGGYWLDQRMKHKTPWFTMVGIIVGLLLGVSSLMRVMNRLSK